MLEQIYTYAHTYIASPYPVPPPPEKNINETSLQCKKAASSTNIIVYKRKLFETKTTSHIKIFSSLQ